MTTWMNVTEYVCGVTMMMIIVDMLSVCSPVHTIWCDSVGFNNRLLFPCSSEAFCSGQLRMV